MTVRTFSVDAVLLEAAERILNLKLQSVPSLVERLTELEGKLIGLVVEPAGLKLFFVPKQDLIQVLKVPPREPDVWIRGTMVNLMKAGGVFSKSGVHLDLSGDVELGQVFQRLLRQSGFDWEELLSLWVGDVTAYWIGTGLRRVASGIGRAVDSFEVSIGEYLLEENKMLVYAKEVRDFVDQVDGLRNDIDRLEARLRKLTMEAV